MKNSYIKNQKDKLEKEIKKITNKKNALDTILLLSSIFIGVCSFYSIFTMANIAVGGLSLLGLSAYYKYKNKRIKDIEIERRKDEKKHLENIESDDSKLNKNLNGKRNAKINSLNKAKEEKEDEYVAVSIANNMLSVGFVSGVITSIINPGVWLMPVALGALTLITGKKVFNLKEDVETLELRKNNIVNDKKVVSILNASNTNQNTNTNTNQNTNTNTNTNQRTRTQTPPPLPKRPQNTQTNNTNQTRQANYNNAVAKYLNKLANFAENQSNKVKTKK